MESGGIERARTGWNAWLALLGIPVAWVSSFVLGYAITAAAGLPEQQKASPGLAALILVVVAILYGIATALAAVLGRRAARAGFANAMIPTWIVAGAGILMLLQNLLGYLAW